MRLLGLCSFDVQNHDVTSGVQGATAELFTHLSQFHKLTFADVGIRGIKRYFYVIFSRCVARQDWREFYGKSVRVYDERSRTAYRKIYGIRHSIDLVFQRQGMFSSFIRRPLKPYVIYTDFTVALGLRNQNFKTFFARYPGQREKWLARERINYQNASRIFTYTEIARQSMIRDYRVDPAKVVTVGVGTRVGLAPENRIKNYEAKKVIFIGHDAAFDRKGVPNLLRAFRLVRQHITDAELLLVGINPDRNIREPGVQITGLIRSREKIGEFLDNASVFAMTPLLEPFGQAYIEAMAKKLPCIGSAVDGIPEVILDGKTGRLVPPEEPRALARALIELLSNKEKLREMGENAYKRVCRELVWEKVTAKIQTHLKEMETLCEVLPVARHESSKIQ
jgi:glycosyltransferase involved in cell wall biosynthesis